MRWLVSLILVYSQQFFSSAVALSRVLSDDGEYHEHHLDEDLGGALGSIFHEHHKTGVMRNIQRLAILRPFYGETVNLSLPKSFEGWNEYPPCDVTKDQSDVAISIFLSTSQTWDASTAEKDLVSIMSGSSWASCFHSYQTIKANINPSEDIYNRNQAHDNSMWVNGPNVHFASTMESISSGVYGNFDAVFVMEKDVSPTKKYWLDALVAEAEESEFAILGSKFQGYAWDEFRTSLPISLRNHLNGNALYNITHPLFINVLRQLKLESDTPYHAVPYDYRISQILTEGILGTPPDLPNAIVETWKKETGRELPNYSENFRQWWDLYGRNSMRESKVIANYAGAKLLPEDLKDEDASLIHGAEHYLPWDGKKYDITLVVSEGHDELATNLLSTIDKTSHPFSKIVAMVPNNLSSASQNTLSQINTNMVVSIHKRRKDHLDSFFDLCDAPIDTDWFMITDSYHIVAKHVDLMFSNDERMIPFIPFTPGDASHCLISQTCRTAHEYGKVFDPENTMVIQDSDMLYNTSSRNEFCKSWFHLHDEIQARGNRHENKEMLDGKPSATSYISYLSAQGRLKDSYAFFDQTIYGKRKIFNSIVLMKDEEASSLGNQNDIVKDISLEQDLINTRKLVELVPSFTPPSVPPVCILSDTWKVGKKKKKGCNWVRRRRKQRCKRIGKDNGERILGCDACECVCKNLKFCKSHYGKTNRIRIHAKNESEENSSTQGRRAEARQNSRSQVNLTDGSMRQGKLIILNPPPSVLQKGDLAITIKGPSVSLPYFHPQLGKVFRRSAQLSIVSETEATEFEISGSSFNGYIQHETGMKVDVQGQHVEQGKKVILWDDPAHQPNRGHAFEFSMDGSICSVTNRLSFNNDHLPILCLGMGESSEGEESFQIVLVDRTDNRRIIFGGFVPKFAAEGNRYEKKVRNVLPPMLPSSEGRRILILKEPQCPWLGDGSNAIAILKSNYHHAELHVAKAREAAEFLFDGSPLSMKIRLANDLKMSMHVMTSFEPGAPVDLLVTGDENHVSSAHVFSLHPDGTIGPIENDEVCIGIKLQGVDTKIVLVSCNDEQRIVLAAAFEVPNAAEQHLTNCIEQKETREELKANASAQCTPEMRTKLRDDGYVKFESAIPQSLVKAARMEINRELGTGEKNIEAYKSNTSSDKASIINLVRSSIIPFLLQELLSGDPEHYRNVANHGQLALRLPGDICLQNSTMIDPKHFTAVRRNWHIDGTASNKSPGFSDFFGEIHNFNVLIGVLLSDVLEPMSGELALYPGSHEALAKWFQHSENVESVRQFGVTSLPHNKTDDLFERLPVHCTGRAGDVFFLNHMTAHFVAPNTRPDVRYAVYFRLSNADFVQGDIEAMVNPWRDWRV